MNTKRAVNNSCRNFLKKSNQFISNHKSLSIFFLALIIFTGIGYATTINEQKITNVPYVNASNFYFGNGTNGFGNFSGNRALVSTITTNYTVCDSGCSYNTIQEALYNVPYFLNHKYSINVKSPYTKAEHIFIPPTLVNVVMKSNDIASAGLVVSGNCSNINEITISSINIVSNTGSLNPYVQCFAITGQDPNNNEGASIMVSGTTDAQLQLLNFTGSTARTAVVAYSSGVSIAQIDLGSTLNRGFQTKHGGIFHFESCTDSTCFPSYRVSSTSNVIGSVGDRVYFNNGGVPYAFVKNGASGSNGTVDLSELRAPIFDATNGISYGITKINQTFQFGTDNADYQLQLAGDRARFAYESSGTANLNFAFPFIYTGSAKGIAFVVNNTEYSLVLHPSGNVWIGNGSYSRNITMTSPNLTRFNCGVNNSGSFSCS